MALIIAGERSGVGKTTVTLALLAALCRSNVDVNEHDASQFNNHRYPAGDICPQASPSGNVPLGYSRVQSFKVGPDYLDPMFHRYVTGRPCRNLDPILTSEAYVKRCFAGHSQMADYALIEGVMGLFDGASGHDDIGSTAHIARLLHVPVVLVLDCRRLSRSVAAIAHGYRSFDARVRLAGVVLNQVGSDRHEHMLRQALEPLDLPIMGVIRRDQAITLPDRHLGLVPTDELPALDTTLNQLAHLGRTCFDWQQLLPLLQATCSGPSTSEPLPPTPTQASHSLNTPVAAQRGAEELPQAASPSPSPRPRIAIARDRAFSFYYADNLDLLTELGADLVEWSPLTAADLPPFTSGLYFGGGFPEIFAAELSNNCSAREAVKQAIAAGMPTYAECGGLMYLCETLIDFNNCPWPMVATLPLTVRMGSRLTLGYRQAIAQHNTPLVTPGEILWGHEFHRSVLNPPPSALLQLYKIRGFDPQSLSSDEGWGGQSLHASYVHLHWGACAHVPARFVHHCRSFLQAKINQLSKAPSPVEN